MEPAAEVKQIGGSKKANTCCLPDGCKWVHSFLKARKWGMKVTIDGKSGEALVSGYGSNLSTRTEEPVEHEFTADRPLTHLLSPLGTRCPQPNTNLKTEQRRYGKR